MIIMDRYKLYGSKINGIITYQSHYGTAYSRVYTMQTSLFYTLDEQLKCSK